HGTTGVSGMPRWCRATSRVWSRDLLEHLRRFRRAGLSGRAVQVVGGHEARVLACLHGANVLVGAQDPRGIVGERDVGKEVLGDILGEVHIIAGQDDGAGLWQSHYGHLTARSVARPTLDDHAT